MSKSRVFSREFKLSALSRMAEGENVSALSRELSVRRKLLYEWRDAFRAGGAEALRSRKSMGSESIDFSIATEISIDSDPFDCAWSAWRPVAAPAIGITVTVY